MKVSSLAFPILAAAITLPAAASTRPAPKFAVPFIADNYTAALKQARQSNRPIFIEAWAPW